MKQSSKPTDRVDLGKASVETRGDGLIQIDVSAGRLNFPAGVLAD